MTALSHTSSCPHVKLSVTVKCIDYCIQLVTSIQCRHWCGPIQYSFNRKLTEFYNNRRKIKAMKINVVNVSKCL